MAIFLNPASNNMVYKIEISRCNMILPKFKSEFWIQKWLNRNIRRLARKIPRLNFLAKKFHFQITIFHGDNGSTHPLKIDRDCACVQYFNSFFTYRKTWLYLNRSNNLPIILIWYLKTIIMIVLCCIICHFQFCFYSLSLSALNHQINFRPFSTEFQFHTSSLDSLNLRNWSLVFPNFMPCYFPHMEKVRTKK